MVNMVRTRNTDERAAVFYSRRVYYEDLDAVREGRSPSINLSPG